MKSHLIKLLLSALLVPSVASAQYYVAAGTTFYAAANTPLNFDSLTIIPSTPLTISNLTIDKTYAPIAGTGGNSVSKVYQFSNPLSVSGTLGMYVANSELNGNTLSALQIAYDPGTGFVTTSTSTVNVPASYVSNNFSTPTTLTKLTAVSSGTVLPIHLLAFDAMIVGDKVKLIWSTLREENTDHFIISRSTDGKSFSKLLSRKAKGGNTETNYTNYDNAPEIGMNYYRLTEVDRQGRETYSAIRFVRYEGLKAPINLSVYPNPATDVVFAELSGTVAQNAWLTLTDMSGKVLKRVAFNQSKISFNISEFAAGMYFANYSDDKNSFSFKLNKM